MTKISKRVRHCSQANRGGDKEDTKREGVKHSLHDGGQQQAKLQGGAATATRGPRNLAHGGAKGAQVEERREGGAELAILFLQTREARRVEIRNRAMSGLGACWALGGRGGTVCVCVRDEDVGGWRAQ